MTARLDVTPKTTEQNRIVRTGESETEVTNNLKKLHSRYCTIEVTKLTILTYMKHRAASLRQQSYLSFEIQHSNDMPYPNISLLTFNSFTAETECSQCSV